MTVVVRTDMPLGSDDRPATRAAGPAGGDHGRDLTRERLGCRKRGSPGEDRIVIVRLIDVVSEDGDLAPLFIVSDSHFAHEVLRGRGRERLAEASRSLWDACAEEPGRSELLDQLFDCQTKRLQLFLLHPERNHVGARTGDQPEATLTRLADRLGFEDGQLVVLVAARWHTSWPLWTIGPIWN